MDKQDWFIIIAAFISFILSVSIWFGIFGQQDKEAGLFVGMWVPSILSFGILLKLFVRGK